MNNILYTQLSTLGFADWLEKKTPWILVIRSYLSNRDKEPIGSAERTALNALVFRWLREEKNIHVHVDYIDDWESVSFYIHGKDIMSPFFKIYPIHNSDFGCYPNFPIAENAAIQKVIELKLI